MSNQQKPMIPFSIVIPARNEELHLPKLLESIRNQTVAPIEIIVADAKSTDKTVEISQEFGAKVVVGGKIGFGRNRGAEVAKGDYILFLDADMFLPAPTNLEKISEYALKNKIDGGSCVIDLDSESKTLAEKINFGWIKLMRKESFKNGMKNGDYGMNMVFKREVFKELGGFDENITHFEDYDLTRRYMASKEGRKYHFIPVVLHTSGRRYRSLRNVVGPMVAGPLMLVMLMGAFFIFKKAQRQQYRIKVLNQVGKVYGEVGGQAKYLKKTS